MLTHHIYMKPSSLPSQYIWHLLPSPSNCAGAVEKTLSDIHIFNTFDEQSVYAHIVVVRGGSVRVICCAPQYLMTVVRLAQKNRELLVESSVTYLRVGDTVVVDTSDQNEVRICYHRNCVTFDFYNQISLVEDLVFQLTIALQLKGENVAFSRPTVRKRKRMKEWLWINILLNRLQTGHKNLKGQSVAPTVLEALQVMNTCISVFTSTFHINNFYRHNIFIVKN